MKRLHTYSQHFIRSPRLVAEMIGHSKISKRDTVYDIGAGSGVIASVLAQRCKHVIAIESEPRTAVKLRSNMARYKNVNVIETDAMLFPLPSSPYKVFANIPFHLSSPLLRRLTESSSAPDAIYLIVQKQFANKLLFKDDGFTGQLGAMVGPLFEARVRKRLRRTDFWPHPNVDTALMELVKRPEALLPRELMPEYRLFIENCYHDPIVYTAQPRAAVGIVDGVKPSQLSLAQWIALFKAATS